MEDVYKYLLIGHVACGFISLLFGLLVILAKKSGKIHVILGNVYFWAMTGVFITSVIMSLMKFNPFLLGVGVFSYYLVFTGFRFGRLKGYHRLEVKDRWVFILTIISSVAMLGFSLYHYIQYQNIIIIVLAIFGSLSLKQSIQDWMRWGKVREKHDWLFEHITRMLGGYIATVTAFLLTAMNGMLPDLVLWLGPGVVGGFGISLTVRHYKKKLGANKKAKSSTFRQAA